MHVSVIMSTGDNRLEHLKRSLLSWSRITHKNFDFTLVNNGTSKEDLVKEIADTFPFITTYKRQCPSIMPNRVRRAEGIASKGDYVVFTSADELLRDYDVLEQLESCNPEERASVLVYYTSPSQMSQIDAQDWLNNPQCLEAYPDFWEHLFVDDAPNKNRKSAILLTNITGATRKYWDWFGWYRDDEFGYLNLDTDVVHREWKLGKQPTTVSVCYHQYHPRGYIPVAHRLPVHKYENEMQARLLEPAVRGE